MTDTSQDRMSNRQRVTNLLLAVAIIVALVATTWFMGERFGWTDIGTGGSNQRLLPKIGDQAPEFFTLREDGQPTLLSQFRGQPVWLNFWGSWCPPCRAEMPEIVSAYPKLTEMGVVVLAVSMREAPEAAMNYRDLNGGTFPVYIDPAFINSFIDAEANPEAAKRFEAMRSDWQVRNFPTHVFIDADGIVRNIVINQLTEEQMIAEATALFEHRSLLPEIIIWRIDD